MGAAGRAGTMSGHLVLTQAINMLQEHSGDLWKRGEKRRSTEVGEIVKGLGILKDELEDNLDCGIDHQKSCCKLHRTHSSPHVHCVFR